MTQPVQALDVITKNAGELVRREHARDLAANVVQALFRLVKHSTLHSIDNQAVVRQVEETVELINDYGQRTGQNISVLFAHGSIFVGGQLLKANRSIYEGAIELGEVLRRCGASELAIAKDVRAPDLFAFTTAVAEVMRSSTPQKLDRPSPRVRLRAVSEAALRRDAVVQRQSADAAIVRTYASAVVIMRRFLEDLKKGRYYLPHRVKRIAQSLVDLSAGETPAFLGVTAVRNANHDDAGRAVNSAILSVSIARQITTDVVTLVRLAMAALLYDTGRPRIAGVRPGDDRSGIIPQLSEQQEDEVPAGTAVVLTALGRVNEPSVMRTVIGYEAQWVRRQARLGPLYRGLRQATMQARIIAVARSFNDLLTPSPGAPPITADEAIATLEADAVEAADRTVLRLLFGALGIFPTGTLLELSTGEVAVVVHTPAHPSKYSQPLVRLVFDAAGGTVERSVEIDLALPPAMGEPQRHIRRVVTMSDDADSALMRAHVKTPGRDTNAPPRDSSVPSHPMPMSGARNPGATSPRLKESSPRPSSPPMSPHTTPRTRPSAGYTGPQGAHGAPVAGRASPAVDVKVLGSHDSQETIAVGRNHDAIAAAFDQAPPEPAPTPAPARRAAPTIRPPADPPPKPTAEGSLTRTPLVHLLVYMLDQRLTGTTVFHSPEGVIHGVHFLEGAPAKVRTGTMVAPLDRVLLELGLLDEPTLRTTLMEISKKKRMLHGRHLVAKGLLQREEVITALRHQVARKVFHLFELPPETRYAYYDGVNLLSSYGGPELTPPEALALIMAGVRLRSDDPLVDATLERISGRPIALHLDAEMRRFELTREETSVCDLLRAKRMTIGDLLGAGLAQEHVVRLTIYALAITRHLDLGVPGRPPVGVGGRERGGGGRERGGGSTVVPKKVTIRDAPPQGAPRETSAGAPTPSQDSGARTRESAVQVQVGARRESPGQTGPRPDNEGIGAPTGTAQPKEESPGRTQPWSDRNRTEPRQGVPLAAQPPQYPGGRTQPWPTSSGEAQPLRDSPGGTQPRTHLPGGTQPRTNLPGGTQPRPVEPVSGARAIAERNSAEAPSPQRPSGTAARRAEIEKRLETVDRENHFELLGLGQEASHDQVQKAYFAIAKMWHPDRLPPDFEDIKPQITRAFSRFNEAYQTLNDPTKRAEYTQGLAAGDVQAEQEHIGRVVEAALDFQKAEVLMKKHDLGGAEGLVRRALAADPDQPEYLTLLVWIQAQRRGDPPALEEGRETAHYDDLIRMLDKVIGKEPRYERALFFRGMLLKRAGRGDKAIRDFRLAADINPKNLDAVREVRVHDMRRRGIGGQTGGLLGKFFNKK